MADPIFDLYVPLEEQLWDTLWFPIVLLLVVLLLLIPTILFIRHRSKQVKDQCTTDETPTPSETDEIP